MSCLPEIFSRSINSHRQAPSKMGGVFSLNLRTTAYSSSRAASLGDIKNKTSLQQRYSLQKHDSLHAGRPLSRSFSQPFREEGLEERGHGNDNLNGRNQGVETASNLSAVKWQAMETLHLATRTLSAVQSEANNVKQQMQALKKAFFADFQSFTNDFCQQCIDMTKEFRNERRAMLGEGKAIQQQMLYLVDQLGTGKQVGDEMLKRFNAVATQLT